MNDLSNVAVRDPNFGSCCKPIPRLALCVLIPLFFLGFAFSTFIIVVVHNAFFFFSFLLLSSFVFAFLLWNALSWGHRRAALRFFLHSFPESDLTIARDGQLVKITGPVSCGNISLESSYEKVSRCIYTSTLLYEYKGFGLRDLDANEACFLWKLAYSERFCTDFYICDRKSGVRVFVKAGSGCRALPLVMESRLINTTRGNKVLSPDLRKWLGDRNLSAEPRLMRLEEGYIKEGSSATVIGMLRRDNDIVMLVQPPELISTGCIWQRLLLSVDFDGLVIGLSRP
ncbi:hypothetical protein Nepgr_023603 [Nepenthes gracilis]|uniref:Uncharacterized protein n=1 Tax=Nepenthes gracilis TaxID=150966 RepID=A0AAD3T355_NEPGR|nr:hypothetical protein Nepgr_023603 [Nepenthes gracilis]